MIVLQELQKSLNLCKCVHNYMIAEAGIMHQVI